MRHWLWKILLAAAVAAVVTQGSGANLKQHEHWNYLSCDRIVRYCVIG